MAFRAPCNPGGRASSHRRIVASAPRRVIRGGQGAGRPVCQGALRQTLGSSISERRRTGAASPTSPPPGSTPARRRSGRCASPAAEGAGTRRAPPGRTGRAPRCSARRLPRSGRNGAPGTAGERRSEGRAARRRPTGRFAAVSGDGRAGSRVQASLSAGAGGRRRSIVHPAPFHHSPGAVPSGTWRRSFLHPAPLDRSPARAALDGGAGLGQFLGPEAKGAPWRRKFMRSRR